MAARRDLEFAHGVPSNRPEIGGRSETTIQHEVERDLNRNFIRNLELCSQAIRNDETFSGALQKTFLTHPKTPYMMRMEKALFDLSSQTLTCGIFHCSVFKIGEKFYLRFMDSGVLKGFFLNAAYNKVKEYISDVASPYIADLLYWTCIFTTEDQSKHHNRYMDKLNAKRNRREHGTTVRETGRRFSTLFDTNSKSFLHSHEGFMAQVTEMMQSGSEECHFVGSVTYILKKINPRTKCINNDRHLFCTGDFQNVASSWEMLLQDYRTSASDVDLPDSSSLSEPATGELSLFDQCRFISSLSNFHYWDTKDSSNVGFNRMLSVRDPSSKYKPASPRNKILLAIRENNYLEATTTFQKLLKPGDGNDDHDTMSSSETFPPEVQRQRNRNQGRTRRVTFPEILQRIGSINPSLTTSNQVQDQDCYESFRISLLENGQILWRVNSDNLNIVCFNDFDIYSGLVIPSKYVHLEHTRREDINDYKCTCEHYNTLLQLVVIGVPDIDIETDLDIHCCHIKFFIEEMLFHESRVIESDNISKLEEAVRNARSFTRPVEEITKSLSSGKTRKFSVVTPNLCGFVHITDGIIFCQSGECGAIFKHARRKLPNLQTAENICHHLQIMRNNKESWWTTNIEDQSPQVDDDSADEDDSNEDNSGCIVLEANDSVSKVFNPETGIWDFPSLSIHKPSEDNDKSLQKSFQKRMVLTDGNGALRDKDGYLWCDMNGTFCLKPGLPELPECPCGASYYSPEHPTGYTTCNQKNIIIVYSNHGPVKFQVFDRHCQNYNSLCKLHYTGKEDCLHLLSSKTAAGDEIGWDFVDKVMKSQITFSGFCDLMTNHYRRLNINSAPFMSVNTFLDWWFSWASKFRIDFRQPCSLCKDRPKMLACDGTKLGIRLRHSNVTPIETRSVPTLIDPSHRRNERSFISYEKGHPKTKEKIEARNHLAYMSRKVIEGVRQVEMLPQETEANQTQRLLENIHPSSRNLISKFCNAEYSPIIMKELAIIFKILSQNHSLSSFIPYRYIDFLEQTIRLIQTEENPNPTIINDIGLFSPEIRNILFSSLGNPTLICDVTSLLSNIINRVREMFRDVKEADEPQPQPGTYNPPKYGCAYYFTDSGERLRQLPTYTINSDCHSLNYDDVITEREEMCHKKFPVVSQQGMTYLFLWFDPLHYGHCYGYHMIPGSEGRKDPFSSAYIYMNQAPEEVFYDFSCQLEEYCLNREPGFWRETRFFHDVFHGFSHKCPVVYKSKRLLPLRRINTEICEQFNSFIQRIKYSARSMSMTRFNFYLQFMIHQWSAKKRANFERRCLAAAAYR